MGQINVTIILIRGRITDKKVQKEENRDLAADKDTKGFGSRQKLRRKGGGGCLPQDCRKAGGQPLLHTLTSESQPVI